MEKSKVRVIFFFFVAFFMITSCSIKTSIVLRNGILHIKKGSKDKEIRVEGNAIVSQRTNGDLILVEIHLNPDLANLILYNEKNESVTTYYETIYRLLNKNELAILLAPPHFNSPQKSDGNFI